METVKEKSSENLHFEVNKSGDGLKTCRSNSTLNKKSICLWVNCSMTDVGNFKYCLCSSETEQMTVNH